MSDLSNKPKTLTVENLLEAMETLREMMSQEGKRITLDPPLYINIEETRRRWLKARDEHPR